MFLHRDFFLTEIEIMKKKIAIQGIQGSFHHQVASIYFTNKVDLVECDSFQELVYRVNTGKCDQAVMAIENSIAGAILPNYALIDEANLNIIGERTIPIMMNLMALPGQQIQDITEVYSHPMALLQCKAFFRKHPHIKLIEDVDTAAVGKRIADQELKSVGALAGNIAAEIYNLEIVAADIHTMKSNTTRFLILNKNTLKMKDEANKASLKIEVKDQPGSLTNLLDVFKRNNLNMSKIQSLPIIDKPWKYAFFIDVLFDDKIIFEKTITELREEASHVKILGTYKSFAK